MYYAHLRPPLLFSLKRNACYAVTNEIPDEVNIFKRSYSSVPN